jgi:hypothetical protein
VKAHRERHERRQPREGRHVEPGPQPRDEAHPTVIATAAPEEREGQRLDREARVGRVRVPEEPGLVGERGTLITAGR